MCAERPRAGAVGELLWRPSEGRIASANLFRFRGDLAEARPRATDPASSGLEGLASGLHRWSVEEPAAFWQAVWDSCRVVASAEPHEVVDDATRMPGARWFSGARLNFAENLLTDRSAGKRRREAIVACNEEGRTAAIGWGELTERVARFAAGLDRAGIRPGDRVAGFLPNIPEAVIAMLATSALGAIWSSCSPDFGADAVLDRLAQIEPKVLVCARGALWAGAWRSTVERTRDVARRLPSLEVLVVTDYGDDALSGGLPSIEEAVGWDDFVEGHGAAGGAGGSDARPTYRQLPFDHPLYILYSSGTTGPPKCIVHGQGGTLVQHLKELVLHCDLKPGDALCYYTTCGWMMWNWMASALATGSTIVLYDGSPFHADPGRMWDVVASERVTHFGTSAKYLALAEKRGVRPSDGRDLTALRTVLSTGSPLLPGSFDWVYGHVGRDLHLASISGGTDLVSCLVLGDPTAPVRRGEIQCAGLGMAVDVWGASGLALPPGRTGELVCTRAFPSMPVGFWDDPEGARYHAAYFEHFEQPVWRHGDWIERTEQGGYVIHGRSDATLNPSGVRIGTAEIYRQVERIDEVVESVAVGQEWRGSERIALFVVLRAGLVLDDELRSRIRAAIRDGASPRHVPALIEAVPELPRTVSGKVSEMAVRHTLHDEPVDNVDALANPDSLRHFRRVRGS